jgi:hypothetical protein
MVGNKPMDLTEQIKSVDLMALVEKESGCRLKSGMMPCPFPHHDDQQPSFKVFDDNRFKCFGCGAGGDAVDFIQKLHDLSFKEALQHLGIEPGPVTLDTRRRIAEAGRKREVEEGRRQRESDLIFTLSKLIHYAHGVMAGIKIAEDMVNRAEVIDRLPSWQYCHDTLVYGTRDEKRICIEALKDMPIYQRDRIFKPNFDFSGWLRKFASA